MPQMSNSIVNLYQNQLEASRQFADAIFSGTEKIDRVVIDATHRAVTEQLEFAQALAGARDQRSLANLPATFMPKPDSAVNYQKEILQVFAEMQNDIGRSIQQYVDQIGNSAAETTSRGASQAQRMSEGAINPMTGMFSVWQSAFNEMASLANRNMQAARSNFENVANTATNVAAQAASSVVDAEEETTTQHRRSTSGSKRK